MAWHDEEKRIRAERIADCARGTGLTDYFRDLGVCDSLAERDCHGGIPDPLFKIRAEHREAKPVETLLFAIKVRPELFCTTAQISIGCGGILLLLISKMNAADPTVRSFDHQIPDRRRDGGRMQCRHSCILPQNRRRRAGHSIEQLNEPRILLPQDPRPALAILPVGRKEGA